MSASERPTIRMPAFPSHPPTQRIEQRPAMRMPKASAPEPPVPSRCEHKAAPFCGTQRVKAPPREPRQPPRPYIGSGEADQRLALFACAANRDRAERLLQGLAATPRARASEHLRALLAAPSSERQGQLLRAFGPRTDAGEALRALWVEAGPDLRREVFALLPPYLKTVFPGYAPDEGGSGAVAPGLVALAARLVREATR
jgi:hypothetical protein